MMGTRTDIFFSKLNRADIPFEFRLTGIPLQTLLLASCDPQSQPLIKPQRYGAAKIGRAREESCKTRIREKDVYEVYRATLYC